MTIKLLVLRSPNNPVLQFIDWAGWVENTGDIATSTVPLQARVCTTVHPIPEHGIGLKPGHWGSWLYISDNSLSWQPKTIPKHNNQSYFSPFYTNNTLSPSTQDHSKRMTDSYYLPTYTPLHTLSLHDALPIWLYMVRDYSHYQIWILCTCKPVLVICNCSSTLLYSSVSIVNLRKKEGYY